MKLRYSAVIVPIAAVALAACGGDDGGSTSASTSMPAMTSMATGDSAAADFNDADVEFLQGMIPHHEQAVEMADIALDPTVGASAEVTALATQIKAAQDPEIAQMTAWLTAWGLPVQMDTSAGHDMSTMEGTMSAEEMDALGAGTGADFDAMWVQMMIRHHQGAIAMAQDVKANGANPDVLMLADQIITAQQAEITEMQALPGGS